VAPTDFFLAFEFWKKIVGQRNRRKGISVFFTSYDISGGFTTLARVVMKKEGKRENKEK